MKKRIILLILATTYIFGCVGLALALGEGNYRKGKYLFRQSCRACHMEKGTGAVQANVLEPLTFTMEDWTRAFSPEKIGSYKCKDEWSKLSPEDINDIYTYLYKFAKDSPTPASCK